MPLISEVVNWRGRVSLISEAVWRGEGVSYFRDSEGRGWVSLISEAPYPHALHPVFCVQDHGVQDHGAQEQDAQDPCL